MIGALQGGEETLHYYYGSVLGVVRTKIAGGRRTPGFLSGLRYHSLGGLQIGNCLAECRLLDIGLIRHSVERRRTLDYRYLGLAPTHIDAHLCHVSIGLLDHRRGLRIHLGTHLVGSRPLDHALTR